MGMLSEKDKTAIRRGAWCNDTSIPAHLRQPVSAMGHLPLHGVLVIGREKCLTPPPVSLSHLLKGDDDA